MRNASNSFWIGGRQERARPPPATELTNTVTVDSRRMLDASARSIMLLLLGSNRQTQAERFPLYPLNLFRGSLAFRMRLEHTTWEPSGTILAQIGRASCR